MSGCQYNGTGCVAKAACTAYTPAGATDAIKAAICNAMVNATGAGARCTYLVGTATCVETVADCAYAKPGSATTDVLAQTACSLA